MNTYKTPFCMYPPRIALPFEYGRGVMYVSYPRPWRITLLLTAGARTSTTCPRVGKHLLSSTPGSVRAPLPVQLKTTLVAGLANAASIESNLRRTKRTPCWSRSRLNKYSMCLGALTVTVVAERPYSTPDGSSSAGMTRNYDARDVNRQPTTYCLTPFD